VPASQERIRMKCNRCTKEAVPGFASCDRCLWTHNEAQMRYSVINKKKLRIKSQEKKWRRVSEGRCHSCGKPLDLDADGAVCCVNCNERIFF
jgi:hypothetical protein